MNISLLGTMEVLLATGQQAEISSDSERALLAYLAVEKNRSHQRESLSTLLWPESEGKQARSNLRVTLHRLRQALQDDEWEIILASKQELQINSEAPIWLDVDEFHNLFDEVKNHPHKDLNQCPDCADKLAEAVDLYRGDFLQGLILEGSYAFQEWTIFRQEGLQRQALEGLHRLTEIYISDQQFDKAEQHARQQLELEPWREEAHQQLMRVLALRGERTAALVQFEHCSKILANELEADPSAETKALFEEIRSGSLQGKVEPEQPVPGKASTEFLPRSKFGLHLAGWKRVISIAVIVVILLAIASSLLSKDILSWRNEIALPAGHVVYDDFNSASFDGAYDSGKWTEKNEPGAICAFVQQDGVLQISHNKPELHSGCTLRIKRPLAVTGSELGSLSARMQLLDTHNGGFTGTVLRITTEFQGGGWAAACGVLADSNSVKVLLDIIDLRLGESREDHLVYSAEKIVDYNTWYEVSLQIDQNTEHIACLIDGQVVGEYDLQNSQELTTALLNREIGVWHEADAEATVLIDNVVFGDKH